MDAPDATQNEQPTMVSHGIKWGLITASIGIIITIVLYVVDYALLGDWKVGLLMIAVYIGLLIYTGITYRNDVGGFLSYGKAFQYTMVIVIVSAILSTIFNILLYQVINPELGSMVTEAALTNQEEMMRSMGAPESSIEQGLVDARTRMENQYKLSGQLLGLAIIIGGGAILALLTSLVVRKNQPMEM